MTALPGMDGRAIADTAAELITLRPTGGREHAVMDHVAAWLADRGVEVSRSIIPVARLQADSALAPFYSAEVVREDVPVLIAHAGADRGGRRLLLNAHVDVVAATHQPGWGHDPFTPDVVDGWLRGRGSADTLGGLAACMHVLAGAVGQDLSGTVVLTPVVGEEDGGCGTLATLATGLAADGAVVVEPTGLAVAAATAGALCFRVTVRGRTAHGSVRHTGVSAIEKGWLLHQAILELEAQRATAVTHPLVDGGFPICMGRIEGGDYRCDEAAWLTIEGRFGTAPQEPVARARQALEDAVAAAARTDPWLRDNPPTVDWIGAQWVGGDTPVEDPLVTAVLAASGGRALTGMSYGCDMGLLRQVADIPTVVYGPGDASAAHAPNERVRIADLQVCAQTLDAVVRAYCA